MWGYLIRVGNSLSQLVNVALLNGHPDECLSGRAYRTQTMWAILLIDTLFFWDPLHCERSYLNDVSNAGHILARHKKEVNYD